MNKRDIIAGSIGLTLLGGVILGAPSTVSLTDIDNFQATYIAQNGKYKQINIGEKILNKNLPQGMYVHEYQSPKGFGYQVFYEDANFRYSKGFGDEAVYRTWKIPKPIEVASTTP